VGGSSIGGLMQTALANKNGELVLPVLVTGNFQNLHFAPDVNKVAQMKMQNLLPSFGNPGQLSSGVLGSVLGRGGANGSNGQGGFGGIVDAISGKKPNDTSRNPPATAAPNQQQNDTGDTVNNLVNLFGGGNKKKKQPPPPQNPPR
jgi:hypothetical protein